jgi:hypothetical protein
MPRITPRRAMLVHAVAARARRQHRREAKADEHTVDDGNAFPPRVSPCCEVHSLWRTSFDEENSTGPQPLVRFLYSAGVSKPPFFAHTPSLRSLARASSLSQRSMGPSYCPPPCDEHG